MNNEKIREWSGQSLDSNWVTVAQAGSRVSVLPVAESEAPRVWQALKREIAQTWAVCGAFEWMALAYMAGSSVLISVFAGNLAHPLRLLATQAMAATILLTLCRIQARAASRAAAQGVSFPSRWWHFWRYWYPHLFFLFCFEELAYLMTLVTPHWQDAKLIAFDYWLTGVHPSVWLEQFATAKPG